MADRVTQLQEAVNQLGDYFCNSVGILQANPESVQQQQGDSKEPPEDNGALFSTLIARTAKDIDILIESLPNQEYTQERQDAALRKLEAENRLAAEKLTRAVEEGELLLKKIREALEQISNSQLGIEQSSSSS